MQICPTFISRLHTAFLSSPPLLLALHPCSVIIKDLVGVIKDGVDDADLPAGVLDVGTGVGAHERGPEDDGQVRRVHAVGERVLLDPVQVQGQRAQRCVVRVW
jgi:hypothetical protein